jgi:hypothetical protein
MFAAQLGELALIALGCPPSELGHRIDQSNLMSRVLKPAAIATGIGDWPGFHTFRHTSATRLFRDGWNAVQVQRRLGHHKPSFTIDVYVHLLESDEPEPLAVGNAGATRGPEKPGDVATVIEVEKRHGAGETLPLSPALSSAAASS